MKNENNQLELFKELGLSEREAKVYTTLLSRKSFTASELQEASDVPRTKIYEIVKKMINRGICAEKKLGKKKVFEAIEPKIALEKILDDQRKEIEQKSKLKDQLVNMFTPLYDEGRKKEEIFEYIEILKDNNQIFKKYLELLDKTENEILFFSKGPYSCDTKPKRKEQKDHEIEFLRRGGVAKGLYEKKELEVLPESFILVEYGQQARVVEKLPVKMLVFDGKGVMFSLDEPYGDNELTMISIEHESIALACKMLFEFLWKDAEKMTKNIATQG